MFKSKQYFRRGAGLRTAPQKRIKTSAPQRLKRVGARPLPKLSPDAAPRGRFFAGVTSFPCAIGSGAIRCRKAEGDGASPRGMFRVVGGFFRARSGRPASPWPLRAIRRSDGWCDDPSAPVYNQPVHLPSRYHFEELWRNDGLYDLVLVLDYNRFPRRKGYGSAIFLHCAREDLGPTAGCIALRQKDLRKLLPRLSKRAVLEIG